MKFFEKQDGSRLPVDESYLLPFLSPTTPGTKYWEGPPPSALTDRQLGRILLQVHQIIHFFDEFGIPIAGKQFCDIGTGNGMVPRLLQELTDIEIAVGSDPFYDGEHESSWQVHDHRTTLDTLIAKARSGRFGSLSIEDYQDLLSFENFRFRPRDVLISSASQKEYKFFPVGANELEKIGQKFDVLYCKAIEHIADWPSMFRSISNVSNDGAVIYFKHRSFFSYLGPHRYSSTCIPWGHVLLNDDEYRLYVKQFHPERVEQMTKFFFGSLAYPRYSISDLMKIANENGYQMIGTVIESPRYLDKCVKLIKNVPNFYEIVEKNYPNVGIEEMFSSIYHVIFKKIQ